MFFLLSIMAVFRNTIILFVLYQLVKYLFSYWAKQRKSASETTPQKKKIIREKVSKYIDFEEIKSK